MLKGFEYNKEYRKLSDKSVYAQEHKVLCNFLASEHENVRMEYGDEREALNSAAALRKWARDNRKPLEIRQRGKYVFGIKTIED